MTPVFLKESAVESWRDYINLKFADKTYFSIEQSQYSEILYIKSKTNNTIISFDFSSHNSILFNCHFYNSDCKANSREYGALISDEEGVFNQTNLNFIDETLDVPIFKGWTSIEYYLGQRCFKAQSYEGKTKVFPMQTLTGGDFGFLYILIFPFFLMINLLSRLGIVGTKKIVYINPIISS